MIPKAYIDAWRSMAPWNESSQVEQEENKPPTAREFEMNLEEKMKEEEFTGDITALLRPEIEYDQEEAHLTVMNLIISNL